MGGRSTGGLGAGGAPAGGALAGGILAGAGAGAGGGGVSAQQEWSPVGPGDRVTVSVHRVDVSFSLATGIGGGGGGVTGGGAGEGMDPPRSRPNSSARPHMSFLAAGTSGGPGSATSSPRDADWRPESAVAEAAAGVVLGVQGRLPGLRRAPSKSALVMQPGAVPATTPTAAGAHGSASSGGGSPLTITDGGHSGRGSGGGGGGSGGGGVVDSGPCSMNSVTSSEGSEEGPGPEAEAPVCDTTLPPVATPTISTSPPPLFSPVGGVGTVRTARSPHAMVHVPCGDEASGVGSPLPPSPSLSLPTLSGARGVRSAAVTGGVPSSVTSSVASSVTMVRGGPGEGPSASPAPNPSPSHQPHGSPSSPSPSVLAWAAAGQASPTRPQHALVAPSVAQRLEALDHMPLSSLTAALRHHMGFGTGHASSPTSRPHKHGAGGDDVASVAARSTVASVAARSQASASGQSLVGSVVSLSKSSSAPALAPGFSLQGERHGKPALVQLPRSFRMAAQPTPLPMSPVRAGRS